MSLRLPVAIRPYRPYLPLVAGAGLVSGIALYAYMSGPGRSWSTLVADLGGLVGATITLDEEQQKNAGIIRSEFSRAGYGWLEIAAITNAYAESRLSADAAGDLRDGVPHSIGLFQLNDAKGAAGEGMSVASREDPVQNCRRILDVIRGPAGNQLRGLRGKASNAELAYRFAADVENCAECGGSYATKHGLGDAHAVQRRAMVAKLFGQAVADKVPA